MIQQLQQSLLQIAFLKTLSIDKNDLMIIDLYEPSFRSVINHLNEGYTLLENEKGWKGSVIEFLKIQILAIDNIYKKYNNYSPNKEG